MVEHVHGQKIVDFIAVLCDVECNRLVRGLYIDDEDDQPRKRRRNTLTWRLSMEIKTSA